MVIGTLKNAHLKKVYLCWQALRVCIAFLLWAAAWFKASNVVELIASDGLLSSEPLLLAIVGFEVGAGLFILIGHARRAWWVSIVIFSVFSIVSAYAALAGVSCNCFAKPIPPQYVWLIDVLVLVLALCLRPKQLPKTRLSIGPIAVCVVIGCIATLLTRTVESRTAASNPLEFLLADTLVGKQWPITANMHDTLRELRQGKWLVLVLRRDCEHCKELVEDCFSDPTVHRYGERTAVFIAGQREWGFQFDKITFTPTKQFRWQDDEPFVASPAVFLLDDGIVVFGADGSESPAKLQELFSSESRVSRGLRMEGDTELAAATAEFQ